MIRAVENMRNLLIVDFTEGRAGMILIFPVKELIAHSDATSGKFKVPTAFALGKGADSKGARFPVNSITVRDGYIMVRLPVIQEVRLYCGIIT